MQRFLIPAGLLILAGTLQGNAGWLSIHGARPDFLLVVLIATALMLDPFEGAIMGFAAGFIHGSIVGISLGSFIISRTLIGFIAGTVTVRLFSENPLVPMLGAGGLTFLSEAVFLLSNPTGGFLVVMNKILMTSLYNSVLTMIAFWILRRFEVHKKVKQAAARV